MREGKAEGGFDGGLFQAVGTEAELGNGNRCGGSVCQTNGGDCNACAGW